MKSITWNALMYVWLAVSPFIVTELNSDTAKEFIPKFWLWVIVAVLSASNIGVAALKSFFNSAAADAKAAAANTATMFLLAALSAALMFSAVGCKTTSHQVTTQPDGSSVTNVVKAPDVAKTDQVKAIAKGVVSFGITESIYQFPQEAENIAKYARAAGAVFCEMKARGTFEPEFLEAALFNLIAPELTDPDLARYLRAARNLLLTSYEAAYAKRFQAELNPNDWNGAVVEVFCDAIDRGLKDAGQPGVK